MRLNNISQNITEEVASKEAWAKLKSMAEKFKEKFE